MNVLRVRISGFLVVQSTPLNNTVLPENEPKVLLQRMFKIYNDVYYYTYIII